MVDKCCMNAGTTGMVRAKVIQLFIPAEEVTLLLVYHQLLDQLLVLRDVQVVAGGWLAGPGRRESVTEGWQGEVTGIYSPIRHFVMIRHCCWNPGFNLKNIQLDIIPLP